MSRLVATTAVAAMLLSAPQLAQAGPADEPGSARPSKSSVVLGSLYASTIVLQGLDVHSTLSAINQGGVEANPMISPVTSHPVAFVAMKAAVTATSLVAAHRIAGHNKMAAIALLAGINSAYAFVVAHNYRVASGR
jgi:hypothetical protein